MCTSRAGGWWLLRVRDGRINKLKAVPLLLISKDYRSIRESNHYIQGCAPITFCTTHIIPRPSPGATTRQQRHHPIDDNCRVTMIPADHIAFISTSTRPPMGHPKDSFRPAVGPFYLSLPTDV